jgi:two-component system sensor histidine kinase DegS
LSSAAALRDRLETDVSTDSPPVLREAQAIVDEQLARMRALVQETRREGEALQAALRQTSRQLDEATVRYQAAAGRGAFGAGELKRRIAALRAQHDALAQEAAASEHAARQLEQFVRQIEMSSAALTGPANAPTTDPWALALRAQAIAGREEERLRLAREVHDGPAQVLANTLMLLETACTAAQGHDDARLLLTLERLRSAVRDGLADVRRFIADLRPGRLDEQGLAAAIGELVRRYANIHGAPVGLDADPLPRLPREVEIVLYRIVQESLQNAYKYARGAPISVRLTNEGTAVRLQVRDEGPGFDPREVARRAGRTNWGLTSMRERAEMIGARFTVASSPGHGAEVTVVLPLG